jgi:hypothetical protein
MDRYDSDASFVLWLLKFRKDRTAYFPAELFGEQAWEMLLTLFIADTEGRKLTGRELIGAIGASLNSGHRWLTYLNHAGLVIGDGDGHVDEVITLSAIGLTKMEALVAEARYRYAPAPKPKERED